MQISRGVKVKKSFYNRTKNRKMKRRLEGKTRSCHLCPVMQTSVTLICQCFSVIECKIRRFKNIKCPP